MTTTTLPCPASLVLRRGSLRVSTHTTNYSWLTRQIVQYYWDMVVSHRIALLLWRGATQRQFEVLQYTLSFIIWNSAHVRLWYILLSRPIIFLTLLLWLFCFSQASYFDCYEWRVYYFLSWASRDTFPAGCKFLAFDQLNATSLCCHRSDGYFYGPEVYGDDAARSARVRRDVITPIDFRVRQRHACRKLSVWQQVFEHDACQLPLSSLFSLVSLANDDLQVQYQQRWWHARAALQHVNVTHLIYIQWCIDLTVTDTICGAHPQSRRSPISALVHFA